ncbi:hypothetical protein [Deinococcus cellulosilyticus]|nr:hypothetical protein [Deinococcus cellulosilyticus]
MALQGLADSHSQVGDYQRATLHFEEARQHALQVKHQEEWAWAAPVT